jgi:hypothetical protein
VALIGAAAGSLLLDVVIVLGLLLTYWTRIAPFTSWSRRRWLHAGLVICAAGDVALLAIIAR